MDRSLDPTPLRAALPLCLAVWVGTPLAWLLGLLGAGLVARADRRAPVRAWRRRHPPVRFDRVRRFPRDGRALAPLAAAAAEALSTPMTRRTRRAVRRDAEALIAATAELLVQRERAATLPALQPQIAALDARIAAAPAALEALRRSALLGQLLRTPDLDPLARLQATVRHLEAEAAADAEVRALAARRAS